MPWARSRSSWTAPWRSSPSWSSRSRAAAGSVSATCRASRTVTASATRCCWAPSCRLRSILRRSRSAAATTRAREARNSSARRWSSRSDSCSAVSSCMLCRARPSWRASSASTVSSASLKRSASGGRSTTMRPSSSPEWVIGASRTTARPRPSSTRGNQTSSHAAPVTRARATTGRSDGVRSSAAGPRSGTDTTRSRWPADPVHTSAACSAIDLRSDSTSWSSSSSKGMARVRRAPKVRRASSGARGSP